MAGRRKLDLPLLGAGKIVVCAEVDKQGVWREKAGYPPALPPVYLPIERAGRALRELFFVSLTVAGRTNIIGGALHTVFFLGSAPFRGRFTDTFDYLLALAGWTWSTFFIRHKYLLKQSLLKLKSVNKNTVAILLRGNL